MLLHRLAWLVLPVVMLGLVVDVPAADPPSGLPRGLQLEEQPKDAKPIKIVLIAGSNFFKAGEHEYIGGCAVLADLLRQTPGVFPVLALDWPKKAETFQDAQAVVFLFDGGDKHALLEGRSSGSSAKAGPGTRRAGPVSSGDRLSRKTWAIGHACWMRRRLGEGLFGAGPLDRRVQDFPDHPICRGVKPFKIDDGWLYKLRFVADKKGVTPLLRTGCRPRPATAEPGDESIVVLGVRSPRRRPLVHLHGAISTRVSPRKAIGASWSTASSGRLAWTSLPPDSRSS